MGKRWNAAFGVAAAILAMATPTAPAFGQPLPGVSLTRSMIGTYGHFDYIAQEGDLIGMEISVLPFMDRGAKSIIKIADGVLSEIYVVDLKSGDGGALTFEMPCKICTDKATAHGKLMFQKDAVHVRIEYPKVIGYTIDEVLKKGPGYWDSFK